MDWRFNTIWTDLMPENEYSVIDYKGPMTPIDGSYLFVDRYKTKASGFEDLTCSMSPKFLYLTHSNQTSFSGISKFRQIKRIELHYCLKLVGDTGISEINESIEWLHINMSKRFVFGKELLELKNLKVLCLNSCGPIESLDFLNHFPSLLDFRFVDTTILNGDLTPLLRHPALVNAGFLDKRHYNLKSEDVREIFAAKNQAAKELIFKGQYQTFRYKTMALEDV